jgi:hypothetical protein
MHFKNGKIQKSFIKKKHLVARELSVWRIPDVNIEVLAELAAKLPAPANDAVESLHAAQAADVRALKKNDGTRAFSVIDDTTIDAEGNKDAQHCVIAPCREWNLDQETEEGQVIAIDLVNKLYLLFKDSIVWQRSA